MNFGNLPREAWIGLFVLFALATQNPSFFGLLFLVGMLMFTRSMMQPNERENNRRRSRPRVEVDSDDVYTSRRSSRRDSSPRVTVRETVREQQVREALRTHLPTLTLEPEPEPEIDHVAEAITTAGLNPDTLPVRPIDLGLLVYKSGRNPEIHRTLAVPSDADYVRPFVELALPRAAQGRIRFEILDSAGHSIFVDEVNHEMKKGKHPLVAATWLPIHDAQDFDGMWQLKISADGVLLANHVFEWERHAKPDEIRQHIQEDGEISPELRQIMAENRLQKMSLDELLSDQSADDAAQKASASASNSANAPRSQKR